MQTASKSPFDVIAQARENFPRQRRLFELTVEARDALVATETCCRALREAGFLLDQLRTSPKWVFCRLVDRPGANWRVLSDRFLSETFVQVSSVAVVIEFAQT